MYSPQTLVQGHFGASELARSLRKIEARYLHQSKEDKKREKGLEPNSCAYVIFGRFMAAT